MFHNAYTEMHRKLQGVLTVGSLWVRGEYTHGVETYRTHFTVLDLAARVTDTKILVHDGELVGKIVTLNEFEQTRAGERYSIVSYWYVPDDQIDRVHFGS